LTNTTDASAAVEPRPSRFLRRVLLQLRWGTITALLVLGIMQPSTEDVGLPAWLLVIVFAGYNLLVELVRMRWPRRFSFTWLAGVDLAIAGLLYALAAEAGGPLFVLFVLAVDSAAAGMTLRGTLLYTAAVAVLAGAIDVALPLWAGTPMDVRRLGARLVILALVGAGMAIVMRRLILEQEVARSVRDESERLEAVDQVRATFISTISHDLRTPLTAAGAGLGLLETSLDDRLRDDERELLGNVRRNTGRLNLLIDDLLAFNQLEAGMLRLERDVIDVRTVVTDALSAVHLLIEEKGQRLEVDLPEPLPTEADAHRLEQVLINLLTNAHQHTPTGTRIAVSGRVTADEVVLAVSDTGPGIPQGELERVFQRFHRLSAHGGGSGLGLAIASGIMALHGGRLWVESEPGKGAHFFAALPRYRNGDLV